MYPRQGVAAAERASQQAILAVHARSEESWGATHAQACGQLALGSTSVARATDRKKKKKRHQHPPPWAPQLTCIRTYLEGLGGWLSEYSACCVSMRTQVQSPAPAPT